LRYLKARFPTVNLHAFSPPESVGSIQSEQAGPLRGAAAPEDAGHGQPGRAAAEKSSPTRVRKAMPGQQCLSYKGDRGVRVCITPAPRFRPATMMFRAHRNDGERVYIWTSGASFRTRPAASPRHR